MPKPRTSAQRKALVILFVVVGTALGIGAISVGIVVTGRNKVLWDVWIGQSILYFVFGLSLIGMILIAMAIRPNRPTRAMPLKFGLWFMAIAMLGVGALPIVLYVNSEFDGRPKIEIVATVIGKEQSLVVGRWSRWVLSRVTFDSPSTSRMPRTVNVSAESYKSISEADRVSLQIGKGLLGLEYIDSMVRVP